MFEAVEVMKRYRNGKGVGPVSFTVAPGEVLGVVGPNGSGKSTLFNTFVGLNDADMGTWLLDGRKLLEAPQRCYGFLPEQPYFFPTFRSLQFCHFDATMRGIEVSADELKGFLTAFGCGDILNEKMKNLSQGLAKRVVLASAFLGNPDLIILDEPVNSLDIQSVILLKAQIAQAKARGASVIFSSHVLDFFDDVADKVIFLNDGLLDYEFDPGAQKAEQVYKDRFLRNADTLVRPTVS